MGGNSFGEIFKVTTFGESHGKVTGAVIDGCPSGVPLAEDDFEIEMARRRPGRTDFDTPRRESDKVSILSGVFEGLTTGAPVALLIENGDAKSGDYNDMRNLFRPGHADYSYCCRYGHFDYRGGGRSSARETAARVAAGVLAAKILAHLDIKVFAFTAELGGITANRFELNFVNENGLCCPDRNALDGMMKALSDARDGGDSLGGIVGVIVNGCPAGLGEPVFDKLDADLAKGIMSIGSVKGVEIGSGFAASRLRGSANNDPIAASGSVSNNAGGILGGISNGSPILLRAAVKPIPSISIEQDTIDRQGRPAKLRLKGRFDVCAIPRIIPVIEAMVMIVLADHYLRFHTAKIKRLRALQG